MQGKPPQPPLAGMTSSQFITGAVVGGLATYVLTHPAAQRAMINGAAQLWMALKGGVEETRERFRDAEAEIKATRAE
ncbi:MAG: hypothetical protein AAGI51_00230 [Pseudomonadota bacterium]